MPAHEQALARALVAPHPLASVLIQEAVEAAFSGRAILMDESTKMAGTRGEGDSFMLGGTGEARLPSRVVAAVRHLHAHSCELLGPVDIEWVFDGSSAWIVQLNSSRVKSRTELDASTISWIDFAYRKDRLEEFRKLASSLRDSRSGIVVHGNVSALSHVGEIAQILGVPVRFTAD